MEKKVISEAVIKRLPKYYRQLRLLSEQGQAKVSSHALAQMLGITASQVRQDFCNFGGFGQQGYGYDVEKLKGELGAILGLTKEYAMIIVGAGNIGRALAGYQGFGKYGFRVKALFDAAPASDRVGELPLYSMDRLESYLRAETIDMAVIATPKQVAQQVADRLTELGVTMIWNFAPIDLTVQPGVVIENISMSESLLVLSYRANENKD